MFFINFQYSRQQQSPQILMVQKTLYLVGIVVVVVAKEVVVAGTYLMLFHRKYMLGLFVAPTAAGGSSKDAHMAWKLLSYWKIMMKCAEAEKRNKREMYIYILSVFIDIF